MRALELRLPPPVVALLAGSGMGCLAGRFPAWSLDYPGRLPIAVTLALLGLACDVLGLIAFARRQTTLNPFRPHAASVFVRHGIYRFSRNPMYLGLASMLAGWAAYLANPLVWLLLPAFVAYLTRFQIIPEERALTLKFGADYLDYLHSVRRWI